VPLAKLNDHEGSTWNNVEAANQSYLDDALMPITVSIEQALSNALLFDDEIGKYCFRFDYDSMLRADMKTRFASYQQGILSGWMNANEIRAAEGMEPIPGEDGNTYRFPVNTAPGSKPNVNTPDEVEKPKE
jgi:HK97 family phage portal protein